MNLHNHLLRQISRHLGNSGWQNDSSIVQLFEAISQSYHEFDKSQKLSDRAFNLADKEYQDLLYKLKESEARTKLILDGALDAVISMNKEGYIIDWNPEAERVFGYTYDEAHGKMLSALIIPDTLKDAHHRGIDRYMSTGHGPVIGKRIEIVAKRASGELFPVELTISVLENKGEKFFNAFLRDISERKKAEKELKQYSNQLQEMVEEQTRELNESEARLRTITENAPDYILEIDHEGKILFTNRLFSHLTSEQVIGKSVFDFMMIESHQIAKASIEKVFAMGAPVQYESQGFDENNAIVTYLTALAPVKINDKVSRLILSTRDITDRKNTERELISAKEQAEAANAAKTEFLANVSHELRTPLNGVIGFVDLLTKTPLTEVQHKYLNIVSHSANSLLNLIDDILNFSRLESGKQTLNNEPFDLKLTCHQVVDMVRHQANKNGLKLIVNISDSIPSALRGDEIRIKQVFANLLSNAVKFTKEGEVEFSAMLLSNSYDSVTIRFEVRDTGIGIKPENQQRIFEAFVQEDVTTTKRFGGTGLGLTISNKILELMGSKLGLHSEEGKGSIFYFNATFLINKIG